MLFVVVALLGQLKEYTTVYLVMLLHESTHLLAAACIGLKPESLLFAPFGVNLKLKNKIILSLSEEIILYLSGPLLNGVLALAGVFYGNREFYQLNTALMVMNLLPILPLDGGMIFLRVISAFYSRQTAERILTVISFFASVTMLVFACICLKMGYINISLFIISVFLFGNVLTVKKMYDTNFIYSLKNSDKKTNKVRMVILDDRHSAVEAIKNISPMYTTVAVEVGEDGEVKKLIPEKNLIESISFHI